MQSRGTSRRRHGDRNRCAGFRSGGCRPGADDIGTRHSDHPGEQCRRRVRVALAGDERERLGRSVKANLRHVLLCTQRVARELVAAEMPGSIINLTSIEGVRAAPRYAAYSAAKAGVINYTRTAAFELAPYGIRVNALAPNLTVTDGLLALSGGEQPGGAAIPMKRPGHVDEIAGAAVFLASGMSNYITGQTLHVDGGTQAAGGWYHHPQTGAPTLGPG